MKELVYMSSESQWMEYVHTSDALGDKHLRVRD